MAMSQSTLATELEKMTPSDNEADSIQALTDAYGVFATGAAAGVPISSAGVDLGKTAMSGALVGMSADGAGITKIPAAVAAFWVAAAVPVSFVGSIAVVPPPNAGLAALLAVTLPANMAASATLAQAAAALAANMYSQAIIGGLVTFPGAPPVVVPIL